METLSSQERQHNLQTLANETFDVLVIGGGVTGAGVALDAALRGYTVALVEKIDFAGGTSSKSTKLVHGGIRYLPNFDFALVHEALVERGLLLQNAPFLVQPIEFVLPIYENDRHPVGMPFTTPGGIGLTQLLQAGLTMYDVMSGKRGVRWHRHLKRDDVLRLAPALVKEGLKDGFTYSDAQTNDARLTITLIRTAARNGAIISNYCEVTSFLKDGNKIKGTMVRDRFSDNEFLIRSRHVVNATGVYAEQLEELSGDTPQISVEPSKGVHLVLSRETLQLSDTAIVLPETEDKRILFIVPWGSRAIFGTTDTGSGDLDHPLTTQDDITYLLKYLNRYLSVHLTQDDIISTYAGYRPLVKPRATKASTARLSRTHAVLESPSGLVTIVGGKLTTYRRMAQDTVDVLSKRDEMKPVHPTQHFPLLGSAGWNTIRYEIERRAAAAGLPLEVTQHLRENYGTSAMMLIDMLEADPSLAQPLVPDLPYIKAEVLYACRHEMAMTPADVLSRRTSITLEDKQRGLGALNEVASMMAKELGWSAEQRQQLMKAYRDRIELQLAAESGHEITGPKDSIPSTTQTELSTKLPSNTRPLSER